MATQLAIVMAQARLHERVTRQAAELEHRVEERTRALSEATAETDRANQAKSEFLSRMSHELRTPLNAILGFAQSAEDGRSPGGSGRERRSDPPGRPPPARADQRGAGDQPDRGQAPAPLAGAGLSAGDAPLRQAIELVGPSARGLRVSVRVEVIDERLHVLADRQRLQQVLLNLFSNAVKYNRPGGAAIVSCEPAAGNRLRIHVSDTGPGIAPDKLERLFTAFDRLGAEATGVEGTGLGLALSKHLVDAMQGTLRVQSEVGVGSTFSVELPLVEGPPGIDDGLPVVALGEDDDSLKRHLKVLYVEDNLSNLRLVERILGRRPGVTLLSAMQGRVGLELARDHQPDLILLDRHLPDLSGDEVLRLLHDDPQTQHISVVILSADASPAQIRRLLAAGARAYLTKPLDVDAFLKVVDDIPSRDGD